MASTEGAGGAGNGGVGGADFAFLQGIFDQAAEDQKAITKASVEGNTRIAASKEKPKI
jgi:hypothetical protein